MPDAHTGELIRQTVYLDTASDDTLEAIRAAGRRRKVDTNRSAVIRLALRRLAAELTPDEVAGEIERAAAAAGPRKPGRQLI